MTTLRIRRAIGATLLGLGLLVAVSLAHATPPNQFGGQDRANAASQMIVVAVQQGISSLPPTSAQSFVYDYDAALDTYIASPRLGPISFRSPLTIGKNRFSVRLATSYFDLSKSFGPILYSVNDLSNGDKGFTKFGLTAQARVGLINVGANYGINATTDLSVNLPITIVDANAEQSFPILSSDSALPPGQAPLRGATSPERLNALLQSGAYVLRKESFAPEGKKFNYGTSAGLGRVSLGGKWTFLARHAVRAAFSTEVFLPSPNQAQFAGTDSTAILPRLIGMYEASELVRFHTDVGYDYDFSVAQLRRFTWNVGSSIALTGLTFDFGVGGSKFSTPLQWTPSTATGSSSDTSGNNLELKALGNTTLGTNYVDFLGGFKIRITENSVIGGSVNVPLTSDGFRAAAVGTIAAELYF
jgi:hypothetical protein